MQHNRIYLLRFSRNKMKRRQTESKMGVLNALKKANSALSHDMLETLLDTPIDRATIYRVLNSFCEDGLVHKTLGDDGKQYFALCNNCSEKGHEHRHNHFHFRCLNCGKVECLKSDVHISLPSGYAFENFNGFITGRCSLCI